jgi:hypothetical protein
MEEENYFSIEIYNFVKDNDFRLKIFILELLFLGAFCH